MNATIEKFGYPATLLAEFEHWVDPVAARTSYARLAGSRREERRHRVSANFRVKRSPSRQKLICAIEARA